MPDRCIQIDGALVRVSDKFDATEGSEDMLALQSILKVSKERLEEMANKEDAPKNYEDAVRVLRIDMEPGSNLGEPDNWRVLGKCVRCGALVTGGLSRERHDNFHTALAELWDMLEKAGQ